MKALLLTQAGSAAMVGLLRAGRLDPTVGDIIPLEAIPDGLRRLTSRHVRGKIVAQIRL